VQGECRPLFAQTLDDALARFCANPVVSGWFPAGCADTYVKHKRGEIAFLEGKAQAEICEAYAQVY
jgi:glutamine synthetase